MKKSSVFLIALTFLIVIFIISFLFHLVYFSSFHKNIQPASASEKERAIEILNQSLDLQGYEIKIYNVYSVKGKEFVQADLISNHSRGHYVIDLKEKRILRR